ncbi:MAG: hypothetical protein L6R42_000279 [Xanthoria sp. 1 TBL-2021]|nr:MAG: hypothetical protein L6R42_000279 [Xanthoria sp. 1 TBL-2021]
MEEGLCGTGYSHESAALQDETFLVDQGKDPNNPAHFQKLLDDCNNEFENDKKRFDGFSADEDERKTIGLRGHVCQGVDPIIIGIKQQITDFNAKHSPMQIRRILFFGGLSNRLHVLKTIEKGEEYPATLASVGNLASVLQYQGKYEEAEQINRRALDWYKKVLGEEHPNTLISVGNLASVLRYQGKYEEAEQIHRRALDGVEKVLGEEHPGMVTSVDNLALVLQDQGKHEEAEQMNRPALNGREKGRMTL